MRTIDRDDSLGLNDLQLQIVSDAVPLEPLAVDELVADRVIDAGPTNEAGAVRVRCFTGPKISRLTAYRFHRAETLNEHLFHAWPAEGYDLPALTTVIFEMPQMTILGADLLPIADPIFDRTYYGRWLVGYADLLAEHWPGLVAHRLGPEPPPDPYFTKQIGSVLSVLLYLDNDAVPAATAFLHALTRHWTQLHSGAEPRRDALAAATEARRVQLMTRAYKGLDYHSPASDGLASVLGWAGANRMFDSVFGDDAEPQPLDQRRTYLDVAVSPGTITPGRPAR